MNKTQKNDLLIAYRGLTRAQKLVILNVLKAEVASRGYRQVKKNRYQQPARKVAEIPMIERVRGLVILTPKGIPPKQMHQVAERYADQPSASPEALPAHFTPETKQCIAEGVSFGHDPALPVAVQEGKTTKPRFNLLRWLASLFSSKTAVSGTQLHPL